MHISDATDLWLADLTRRRRSVRTIDGYRGYLNKLDEQYRRRDVKEISTTDLRQFVDRWAPGAATTSAQIISIMHGFFGWLMKNDYIERDPSLPLERPPLPSAVDRDDVPYITSDEVRKMFAACEDWTDTLTLGVLALTCVRREAAAQFRLCHWNRERGQVVFTEKGARGGRKIEKPMPEELARLIEAAETAGVYASEDDFVIPPRAALRRTDGTRSAAVLLKTVKKIGKRAGCSQAYVHAFRAAYAEHYVLEQRRNGHGDGDIKLGLQMIMGHKQAATTDIYLRRLDRSGYMEPARAFSWGSSPALPSTVGDTAPIHAGSGVETSPDLDGHPVGGAWLTEKEGFEPSTDATPQPESEPVQLPETFDLLDLLAGRHVDVPPSTPAGERLPAAAPTLDPDWTPEAGYSHADKIRRILEAKEAAEE